MSADNAKQNGTKFFRNVDCEFFPCHEGADPSTFNCMFCYCPLYALGRNCGGNFRYLDNGIKDCSGCMIPHREDGYDHVMSKVPALFEKIREQ